MPVKTIYQTTEGSNYENEIHAQIADALEQTYNLYLESYKLKTVIEAIDKAFILTPRVAMPNSADNQEETPNETI